MVEEDNTNYRIENLVSVCTVRTSTLASKNNDVVRFFHLTTTKILLRHLDLLPHPLPNSFLTEYYSFCADFARGIVFLLKNTFVSAETLSSSYNSISTFNLFEFQNPRRGNCEPLARIRLSSNKLYLLSNLPVVHAILWKLHYYSSDHTISLMEKGRKNRSHITSYICRFWCRRLWQLNSFTDSNTGLVFSVLLSPGLHLTCTSVSAQFLPGSES